ncbi:MULTISPECIES: helix-turn-helix transcriptional regulator [unclassified Micromonospora]|uniref:helix-turn-helix domain-containing protein n=1 Tax=unclassified Micromonospora TaxID=2617518 RepID=UPI00098D3556|nr:MULTISPECIES: helix-turn-helix transcriptional regulator [unclassified Micromonospora]MDI5936668.1 helix-turn-helix transcriptional regulator [Micromonospora sp. DH15]OON33272.1 DNA-binding protein [Micromonospora sp. Rc5]
MVTPTIQRRRLGNALKRAREAAGKTQEEAAEIIDSASSKVSRLELGQSGIRLTDLKLLLDFYGVAGEEAEPLRELARAGRQRGRWSGYRNVVPDWFRQYLDLEADAAEIRWYQSEVIPGILQTEPYIRAIIEGDDVEQQTAVRLERQKVIDRPDGPELNFILSESALRRDLGDRTAMREQLSHIAAVAGRPNVTIQVFPLDAETYVTSSYNFIILRFGEEVASDVVYLETFTDADYLDSPEALRSYNRLWGRLQAAALGPAESRKLIRRIADEMK